MDRKQRPARILAIQTAFPGDIVLTTPFLRGLRALFPQAEIDLITSPAGAEMLAVNPWNIRVQVFDKRGAHKGMRELWRYGRKLREKRYDILFCLHRSWRSGALSMLSGAAHRIGFAGTPAAFGVHKRVARRPGVLEAQKNLDLLNALVSRSVEGDIRPELRWSEAAGARARALLAGTNDYAVLSPSSVWATKRWPAERYSEVGRVLKSEFGLQVAVVGGNSAEDIEVCAQVAEGAGGLNLSGKTSLPELAALLSGARIVIANDSAPLHMATAVGAKGVAIFGPTTEALGFFPHATRADWPVAEVTGLTCRPCGKHGHRQCPLGHFQCMLRLDPALVLDRVREILCR